MYVETRQLGLVPAAAIPVAAAVIKNLNIFSMFGGKLIWGLKREEFEQRHSNSKWFRYLWYNGYWAKDGAAEIPSGLSTQDYYVKRFNIVPFIPHYSVYEKVRQGGSPDSSLRLTSIPAGMRWPTGIENIPLDAIQRVLPRGYRWDAQSLRAVAPAPVFVPPRPGVAPAVEAVMLAPPVAVSELVRSPVVLVGLGLAIFIFMQSMTSRRR